MSKLFFFGHLKYNMDILGQIVGVQYGKKKKKPYEVGELDQYLFGQGNHYEIYNKLGAHFVKDGKKKGYILRCGRPMRKVCL